MGDSAPDRSGTFARAMQSLYRSGGNAQEAAHGAEALDVAFEKLSGELRLFPGQELAARAFLTVEEFHLRRRIGAGGMGSVYLAWSESLRREVALKVLHAEFEGSHRHELLQEARNLAAVKHPNVVQIHQIKSGARWTLVRPPDDPGPPHEGFTDIIVMEYVEGRTLLEWLELGQSWRAIVDVFVQAAHGLAAAHRAGLLHSDVTPRNILVDAADTAKLIDFGLSHPDPTQHGEELPPWYPELHAIEPAGTPGYVAPELLLRGELDARSDLFALCVSLWQALTGVLPYPPDALAPSFKPPAVAPPLELTAWPRRAPLWLRDLLSRGLDFDPAGRPANMTEFAEAIEARLLPWSPWWGRMTFSVASAALVVVVFMLLPEPPAPFPLGRGDPGIEQVWSPARASSLAAAKGPRAMRAALARIRDAIETHATTWTTTRDTVRKAHDSLPVALQERAALCLVDAILNLDTVLAAVDESIRRAKDTGMPWARLADGWLAELRPPTWCANAPYLTSLTAAPGLLITRPGQQAWSRAYAQGHRHFLAGDLDRAEGALRRALVLAGEDPARQAWSRFRLMAIDSRRGRSDAAVAHIHAILALTERSGDAYLRILALAWLVREANESGEYDSALALYAMATGLLGSLAVGDHPLIPEKASYLHTQAAWTIGRRGARGDRVRCPTACAPSGTSPGASQQYARDCADALLALAWAAASGHETQTEVAVSRAEIALLLGQFEPAHALARVARRRDAHARAVTPRTARIQNVLASAQYELEELSRAGAPDPPGTIQESEISFRYLLSYLFELGEHDTAEVARVHRILAAQTETRGAYDAACVFAERAREIVDRPTTADATAALEAYDILGSLHTGNKCADGKDPVPFLRRGLELAQNPSLAQDPSLAPVYRYFAADIHLNYARVMVQRGDLGFAAWLVDGGLGHIAAYDDPALRASLLLLRAEIDVRRGDRAAAHEHLPQPAEIPPEFLLHLQWLSAWVHGPADPEARALARTIADRLAAALDDEFLDTMSIHAWLAGISRRN